MKRIAFAIAGILLLAACASEPVGASHEQPSVSTISGDKPDTDIWHGRIDGVECITVTGNGYGDNGTNGISCNWQPK